MGGIGKLANKRTTIACCAVIIAAAALIIAFMAFIGCIYGYPHLSPFNSISQLVVTAFASSFIMGFLGCAMLLSSILLLTKSFKDNKYEGKSNIGARLVAGLSVLASLGTIACAISIPLSISLKITPAEIGLKLEEYIFNNLSIFFSPDGMSNVEQHILGNSKHIFEALCDSTSLQYIYWTLLAIVIAAVVLSALYLLIERKSLDQDGYLDRYRNIVPRNEEYSWAAKPTTPVASAPFTQHYSNGIHQEQEWNDPHPPPYNTSTFNPDPPQRAHYSSSYPSNSEGRVPNLTGNPFDLVGVNNVRNSISGVRS